jgi:hypothetical protein
MRAHFSNMTYRKVEFRFYILPKVENNVIERSPSSESEVVELI